ncbi:protein phosphatase 1 regulatory subunit 42-like isoform X1 [Frieseomelitta varia]|uniref:protein phosphatase 1 regulatory subunit 42-like isoform X1 n=1 Tax=Frieseomelitta varia TaxID=561572 RepID=UPI001CB68801|nr:protein phosphatase 1 regulatory subunit 42-like isoform X1 [Frieseomelitta varia]
MVRLTTEYIERKCSQIQLNKSLSKKLRKDELYNLTHLRMNNMFISSIGNFVNYKNLKVIYLQNNNIAIIENLYFASNLTHLYLQHNEISKIENLNFLEKLQTLYLGYNKILVVEGLECLRNLTILQIENQKLPIGESLCFDPRSIFTLSTCLKILNISGNKMTSLKSIEKLHKLEVLDVANNFIDDINDLTESISALTSLTELSLQGNPVTQYHRYRENLIANNDTLKTLDGKTVTDICRCFMKRFKMKKHFHHTKKSLSTTLDEDITSSLNLPPSLKESISRAIFQNPDPKLSTTSAINETQSYIFPSWKIGINTVKNGHITPKPFWSNVVKTNNFRNVRSMLNNETVKLPFI